MERRRVSGRSAEHGGAQDAGVRTQVPAPMCTREVNSAWGWAQSPNVLLEPAPRCTRVVNGERGRDAVVTVRGQDAAQILTMGYDDPEVQHDPGNIIGDTESSVQRTGLPQVSAASSSSTAFVQPAG
eukprot:617906-Pyramimonas_sp.AAC.1